MAEPGIDIKFDVCASDETGRFAMTMRLPGETTFGHAVTHAGDDTFDGTPHAGTFGYRKGGVYRHDATLATGGPATRVICHGDVHASATAVPAPTSAARIAAALATIARRRRAPRKDAQ